MVQTHVFRCKVSHFEHGLFIGILFMIKQLYLLRLTSTPLEVKTFWGERWGGGIMNIVTSLRDYAHTTYCIYLFV